ncbi:MAG: hypothetical protein F6J89_13910 [Symploca sp. SIO1C4]|uniref:DUF928 domain-containing protein n=1 Tax=Symploca sp. SIO1C4 TaxID=2607765 RepID=A0A6B3NAT1_9CYAN|nr:hypothetical protein [Symploca sp. SIO1C4]
MFHHFSKKKYMLKHTLVKTTLLITAFTSLSIPFSSVLIQELGLGSSYAVSAETNKHNQEYLWSWLFSKKKERGGSKPTFCSIFPSTDDPDLFKIWNDRPLFIWKDTGEFEIKQIEIRARWDDSQTPKKPYKMESFDTVGDSEHKLVYYQYNDPEPLNHGQEYLLWLKYQIKSEDINGQEKTLENQHTAPFKVIGNSELRNRIDRELEKYSNINNQESAQERAKYFADEELWSDFLQEAFSVKDPSADLVDFKKGILNQNSCTVK